MFLQCMKPLLCLCLSCIEDRVGERSSSWLRDSESHLQKSQAFSSFSFSILFQLAPARSPFRPSLGLYLQRTGGSHLFPHTLQACASLCFSRRVVLEHQWKRPDGFCFYSLLCYLLAGWMTLDKSVDLSEGQFSHLCNGATCLPPKFTVKIK